MLFQLPQLRNLCQEKWVSLGITKDGFEIKFGGEKNFLKEILENLMCTCSAKQ
jgi:hypothetical protein